MEVLVRHEALFPSYTVLRDSLAARNIDVLHRTENQLHEPMEIFENFHVVGGDIGEHKSNSWAYLINKKILIDPGSPNGAWNTAQNLQKLGIKDLSSLLTISTHYHWDHIGSGAALKEAGIPIIGSEVGSEEVSAGSESYTGASLFYNQPPEPFAINYSIKREETFDADGIRVHIIPTPGHSPSDISIVFDTVDQNGNQIRVGIVGDTFLGGYHPAIMTNLATWRDSLLHLDSLGIQVFSPGHIKPNMYRNNLSREFTKSDDPSTMSFAFKAMRTPWI